LITRQAKASTSIVNTIRKWNAFQSDRNSMRQKFRVSFSQNQFDNVRITFLWLYVIMQYLSVYEKKFCISRRRQNIQLQNVYGHDMSLTSIYCHYNITSYNNNR